MARVDTAVVSQQIQALRQNEHAREELQQAREEADRLRQEVESKTRELAALKSQGGGASLVKEREQALAKLDAHDLVVQAWRVPTGARGELGEAGALSPEERAGMKSMLRQAVALDGSNARAHLTLGHLLQDEGDLSGAMSEYREALRINPKLAKAHAALGRALVASGRRQEGAQELRLFLQTVQPTPANQRLIEKVRHRLQELDGQPDRPSRASAPRRPPRDRPFDR